MKTVLAVGVVALALVTAAQDLQRGFRNYQEIMAGRKRIEQLTPQEKTEVIQVYRILKRGQTTEGKSSECQDATDRAKSTASDLADYARKLRNCAEQQDFSDDCSSEISHAKNAQYDYESAVSDVRSHCD